MKNTIKAVIAATVLSSTVAHAEVSAERIEYCRGMTLMAAAATVERMAGKKLEDIIVKIGDSEQGLEMQHGMMLVAAYMYESPIDDAKLAATTTATACMKGADQ